MARSSSRARPAAGSSRTSSDLAGRVAAYRAGYLPEERRELERRLGDGSLLGVAATNALELGIDVGGLDAIVLNGFPGTLASMRQQAGRAGRTGRRAAAVLVAGDDQLDQWYVAHPEQLLGQRRGSRGGEPVEPVRACGHRSRAPRTSSRSSRATSGGSDPASTTRCGSSSSPNSSSHAPARCTGRLVSHRRRGSGCAPGRRWSSGSSVGTTTATSVWSARSTPPACSTSPIRARCTCTRVVSGASSGSTSTTMSRGSNRPTRRTSTPRSARTPTSRSPARTSACSAGPAGRTSARST